jgi:2-polyprenyl-6-methoxyphenol hydroxylase-like FAD-dependent oxidoreductase
LSIIVAGGGIVGLTFALTCHEIGLDVQVFESVPELKPLGVGINLQPNAVKELYQLGLAEDLQEIGIEAEEWALFYYGAHPIWTESRGTLAGYNWPQFSVHRGHFHMCLLERVRERLGEQAVVSDARLTRFENKTDRVNAHFARTNGEEFSADGSILIGADGIHSTVRSQMFPQQGDVNWNGAIMWRGVSRYEPPRTNNSFVMVGGISQRFICYPLEKQDVQGETLLNWIAELRPENMARVDRSDWNKAASADVFMDEFTDWDFEWLNVPDIVERAIGIWEYPMVDRDPIDRWVEGRVALMGDAAHAMFPHGSGGASQGIVDTRVMGACLLEHGVSEDALAAYERRLVKPVNELVVRNRGEGPLGVLFDIEDKVAQGVDVAEAIDEDAVAAFMARYKEAAGTARDALNTAAPIINPR